jgi:hypothetical protein
MVKGGGGGGGATPVIVQYASVRVGLPFCSFYLSFQVLNPCGASGVLLNVMRVTQQP